MELSTMLSRVDHTLLKPESTWAQIRQICDDAMTYHTATVCIPASYVRRCKAYMAGNPDAVGVCTVIGFPTGYATTESKVFEAADAVRNGADEVVFPERDIAEKTAVRFSSNNILDFIQIGNEYSIFQIPVPVPWIGATLQALNIRKKFAVNVLAVEAADGHIDAMPGADYQFHNGDKLLILGKSDDVARLTRRL